MEHGIHSLGEISKRHLPRADHIRHRIFGHAHLLGELILQTDTTVHELGHHLTVDMPTSSNLRPDRPHLTNRRIRMRGSISNMTQRVLKLLARFNTRAQHHRRNLSSITHEKRRALNRLINVSHDLGNLITLIAQTLKSFLGPISRR